MPGRTKLCHSRTWLVPMVPRSLSLSLFLSCTHSPSTEQHDPCSLFASLFSVLFLFLKPSPPLYLSSSLSLRLPSYEQYDSPPLSLPLISLYLSLPPFHPCLSLPPFSISLPQSSMTSAQKHPLCTGWRAPWRGGGGGVGGGGGGGGGGERETTGPCRGQSEREPSSRLEKQGDGDDWLAGLIPGSRSLNVKEKDT